MRSPPSSSVLILVATLGLGCGTTMTPSVRPARPATSAEASHSPSGAPREALTWAELDASTFAKARAEGRFVVVDGSAEWCHWCHVMEATTYHDPEVRRILDEKFVAVKVDIDSRPDFEERYADWGWPATVLMTAEGRELGKYKGYLPPAKFAEILRAVVEGGGSGGEGGDDGPAGPGSSSHALSEAELADAQARTARQLEQYWDEKQAGWGVGQKAPIAWDNAWALARARAGDDVMRARVLRTLDQQRGIIDTVWGGVSQYSTDGDWAHPHFEKLLTVQAGAIANYAEAYALTHDGAWLAIAQLVRRFVDGFMTSPEGGFETTMDADLNAHDPTQPYVTGHEYYANGDAQRRALGLPRVDLHEYARENGLGIAAYVTLYDSTGDGTALTAARRAAARVLASHASASGAVAHGIAPEDDGKVLFLADNAAFGFGLVRLYEATHEATYLEAARKIADFMARDLRDAAGGGFFSSTPDPNAVGVFAARRKPFEDNVMAARFLARLSRAQPTDAYRAAIASALASAARPKAVEDRGRMVGDLLLAIDETRGAR
jgi:uncharacterized protein YyaL (SSP411 family)